MKYTPKHRAERIVLTRNAAAALIEDLEHIREVVAKVDPSRGELRRLSATLRRILFERDLTNVAAPRIGRIKLLAPDNKPIMKSNDKEPLVFFISGGASVLGVYVKAGIVDRRPKARDLLGYNPEAQIELGLDGFLSQRVLCLQGECVSRLDVITFSANIGSGIHSDTARDDKHKLLERLRHSASLGTIPAPNGSKALSINVNIGAIDGGETPFDYKPDSIDPILFELLCAAHYLTISPDVAALEKAIKTEFATPVAQPTHAQSP